MNKQQKQVLQSQLLSEKTVLHNLQNKYKSALDDINKEISSLKSRADAGEQYVIYQIQYQRAIKNQVNGILDTLKGQQFSTISDYLQKSYEDGFVGTMYDLHGQGIPFIFPIDQKQVVKAVQLDSKLSKTLYNSLGENITNLKYRISDSISRGIASNKSYSDIAKQITQHMVGDYSGMKGGALGKAMQIARTESHRITNEAAFDAQVKAKENGADVVKQWDAALDSRTRPHHAQLDGQIREIDEEFEVSGRTALYPGGFGIASEDINCRCAILQRAKWALDDEELETLKKRAEYYGLDKADSFEEFKKKYIDAIPEPVPITYPFEGKQYSMNPDGTYSEGIDTYSDGFEMNFSSDTVISSDEAALLSPEELDKYEAIIDVNGNISVLHPEKLNAVQTGTKWDELTYTLNPDGTYSIGTQKYQAQYKVNLNQNKVLNTDVTKAVDDYISVYGDDLDDAAKFKTMFNSLPKDLTDEITDVYTQYGGAASLEDVTYQVLKNKGYDAVHIINTNSATQDKISEFLKVFDDTNVTKTKKSKLETLGESLAKEQKKLNKIDNKTYSGIWKDDVSVSDYSLKKGSIQAKRDWYLQQIANGSPNSALYQKYLDDLDEFEKLGSQYEAEQLKIKKIQADIKKYTPKTASTGAADAFTQDRKDKAYWFTNNNGSTKAADSVLRDKSGEVWKNATQAERNGTFGYTSGSGAWNRPLSGFEKPYSSYGSGWEPQYYKGVNKVWIDYENAGTHIRNMTNLIEKSSYDFDIWLQRGCKDNAIESYLNLPFGSLSSMSEADLQQFVGYNNRIYSFLSTSVSKGNGFPGSVIMNIYAPEGSKMIYAEPFSAYGNGAGKAWDGVAKQSSFGPEAEMILQRGGSYTVTKIEKKNGTIFMDLEVHPEDGYDLIQQDPSEWKGSTAKGR